MSSARQTRVLSPSCLRAMLGLRDERGGGGRRCRVFERGSPKSVVVAAVSIPSIHLWSAPPGERERAREPRLKDVRS